MINDSADRVRTTLHDLLKSAEDFMEGLGEQGADQYRDSAARLRRSVRRARDELDDSRRGIVRRAQRGMRAADGLAHEHPWETAAAAAALGAAIGVFVAILATTRSR